MKNIEKPADRKVVDQAHKGSINVIKYFLDEKEKRGMPRDISYTDSDDAEGREAYVLVERYHQKAKNGKLSEDQRSDLELLNFTVNGKPSATHIDPEFNRGLAAVRLLDSITERTRKARVELIRCQEELESVKRREVTARIHASEMEEYARKFEEQIRIDTKELALLNSELKSNLENKETKYLSTAQLALKIGYDERTIRDNMVGDVFIEGVHYIQPFGRKILFLWDSIERDMMSGEFKKLSLES